MVMSIRTFFYGLKEGIVNLFKNRLMTFASVGTISACLLVVSIFYIVSSNVDYMVEAVQNNIGIAVFFDEGVSEEKILEIKATVDARAEVYNSTYISAAEAWTSFKSDYFTGREELLSGFEDENPLANSASLQIFLADISKQGELVNYINSLEGIRHIREDRQITDIIKTVSDMIQYVSIVLILVLLLISIFLISNTVRIGIEVRKKEINIMKYIGATDSFIRGPFIVEGALIGILGAVIPLSLVYYFYDDVINQVLLKFTILKDYLVFIPVLEMFKLLVPISIGVGMLIGIFGSLITVTKHLKV